MTQPKRLLDSSPNGGLRDLLRSGLDDAPGPNALPRVALTLGISAGSLAASSGALASGSLASAKTAVGAHAGTTTSMLGAGAATAAGSSATGAGLTLAALGKSLLVSMVSAGSLSVGVIAVQDQFAERAPTKKLTPTLVAQPSAAPSMEPAPARAARSSAAASPAPDHEVDRVARQTDGPLGEVEKRPAGAPARPHARAGSDAPSSGALGAEVERIDSVRRALDSNDATRALSELESYQRSRRLGVLDREALLLRIEALVRQGELGRAKHLAREYLSRFPNDAHAPRMGALVAEGAPSVARLPDE